MNKLIRFLVGLLVLMASVPIATSAFELSEKMKKNLQTDIKVFQKWVKMPLFVNSVLEQNSKNIELSEIKKWDRDWIANFKEKKVDNPLMEKVLFHPLGEWLRKQNRERNGRYPEAFLVDNQGAVIAASQLTSDYWQGDESKWILVFSDKKEGAIVVGTPEYDESSRSMAVQVSIPVLNEGIAIGVLIVAVHVRHINR